MVKLSISPQSGSVQEQLVSRAIVDYTTEARSRGLSAGVTSGGFRFPVQIQSACESKSDEKDAFDPGSLVVIGHFVFAGGASLVALGASGRLVQAGDSVHRLSTPGVQSLLPHASIRGQTWVGVPSSACG